jgi:predicted nucleic acid-binding Zn ribbon protein
MLWVGVWGIADILISKLALKISKKRTDMVTISLYLILILICIIVAKLNHFSLS